MPLSTKTLLILLMSAFKTKNKKKKQHHFGKNSTFTQNDSVVFDQSERIVLNICTEEETKWRPEK